MENVRKLTWELGRQTGFPLVGFLKGKCGQHREIAELELRFVPTAVDDAGEFLRITGAKGQEPKRILRLILLRGAVYVKGEDGVLVLSRQPISTANRRDVYPGGEAGLLRRQANRSRRHLLRYAMAVADGWDETSKATVWHLPPLEESDPAASEATYPTVHVRCPGCGRVITIEMRRLAPRRILDDQRLDKN